MKIFLHVIFFAISTTFLFSQEEGKLFIIGGGSRPDYLMKEFVELAGGTKSKIVIIPMASGYPEEVAKSQKINFESLGCENVTYLIFKKEEADEHIILKELSSANAVFFSGGDQNRLTEVLLGTKAFDELKKLFNRGGTLGGTSAGAAVMSSIMITGDELKNSDSTEAFISIQKGNIKTAQGFGFINNAIIDQHFIKRKRLNRLLSAVLEHPAKIGIGIDESTAIVYQSGSFKVTGENSVLVFDARNAINIKTDKNGNLGGENINTYLLISGDTFKID